MKTVLLLLSLLTMSGNMVLFDFNKDSILTDWRIVNDGVMGGISDGHFDLNDRGHAVFHGEVSLENNGGFSSVRYRFDKIDIAGYSKITLKFKGDGKSYQFRAKSSVNDYYSYVYNIKTTGNWQEVEIPLAEMKPVFRGRDLDIPNYEGKVLEEIAFLIGNKTAEFFKLEIDEITLIR